MKEATGTRERIREAARAEFWEKGYLGASLRNIVKTAGVTTGAFYGYFESKEALYSDIVGAQYEELMRLYRRGHSDFAELPPEEQPKNMGQISGDCMVEMLRYMYQYPQEVRILLQCSEGTKYEHMIHEMAEIESEATYRFIETLQQLGRPVPEIEPALEHMITSGMFAAFFEMVIHDMPYEKAERYLREMRAFYTAGWGKLLGVQL